MGNRIVIESDYHEFSNGIKQECANHIIEFGKQFIIMRKLYDEFGLDYPEECHTNYRDSWFHYRKLYNKRDDVSAFNERYGLEEHLLRAIKDAQICLLQQLGQWLEVWYHHEELLQDNVNLQVNQNLFTSLDTNWVRSLWDAVDNNEIEFAEACVYRYKHEMYSTELRQRLQELIHSLKNLILELRLGGMNISRPLNSVEYVKRSVELYEKIGFSLKENGMLYLLPVTSFIYKIYHMNACVSE